jgi:BlaI family transcriptional regulator, penicillinase repressor
MLFLQHVLVLQHWIDTMRHEASDEAQGKLSRRERQIMDILFQRGSASAAEIQACLSDPPSYSAVRAALRVLERKGHIRHELRRLTYVWTPRVARDRARRIALRHLVRTFFEGNVEQAVAALLSESDMNLDNDARDRLRALIGKAASAHSECVVRVEEEERP